MSRFNPTLFFTLTATAALLLVGCSDSTTPPTPAAGNDSAPTTTPAEVAGLEIDDAWVKAAPDGMSAAFGILTNLGPEPAHITGASTPASASTELHITVDNGAGTKVMQEAADGFEIAVGEQFVLEPGGNHLMLMELTDPIVAGDEVAFTLELADGTTVEFVAVAKDYSGANEHYEHGTDSDHGDHDG